MLAQLFITEPFTVSHKFENHCPIFSSFVQAPQRPRKQGIIYILIFEGRKQSNKADDEKRCLYRCCFYYKPFFQKMQALAVKLAGDLKILFWQHVTLQ
jgi:hypothetical protein